MRWSRLKLSLPDGETMQAIQWMGMERAII